MIENDVVLRQPVELRVRADADLDVLRARALPFDLYHLVAPGVVITACVLASSEIDVDVQPVAARDTARRMHDHRVADGVAFGIERPLHAQRPIVQAMRERRARDVAA